MLVLKPKTLLPEIPQFIDDSHTDMLILLGPHIIPVHSSILGKSSPFFENMDSPKVSCQHKVKIVTQALNIETVISVFKYHYGYQLQIPRNQELIYFMEVALFFEFRTLKDKLINDLVSNFEKYDFFFVLQFAREFGLQKVEELCWEKLEQQDYQQINYNKYDFLCCAEDLYLEVLQKKPSMHKSKEKPCKMLQLSLRNSIRLEKNKWKSKKLSQQLSRPGRKFILLKYIRLKKVCLSQRTKNSLTNHWKQNRLLLH